VPAAALAGGAMYASENAPSLEGLELAMRPNDFDLKAIDRLHRNKMIVFGGLIIGSPGDTREAVEANLEFARRYVDWPYIQHPKPYPGEGQMSEIGAQGSQPRIQRDVVW
jgi:hypothetical protein